MVSGEALGSFKARFEDFQSLLESLLGILEELSEPNKGKCRAALESVIKERGL